MRYLNTYKLFESSNFSGLIDDIKDMTFELSDNGFDIRITDGVNYTPSLCSGSIKSLDIRISNDSIFNWNDIKETVERIEDYCWRKDSGYGMDVEVIADDDWMSLDRFVDVYGDEEFSRPGISLLIYSEDDYNNLIEDEEMNESLSNDKYSIFDFYNDLHYHSDNKLDQSEVQQWVDHFIGEGWFDRIHKHLTKSWDAMSKVDVEYINDRLYDVWDELPSTKDKWVTASITYGDYTSIDEPKKRKYNGIMPVSDLKDESRFVMIMKEIIRSILLPTFRIGGWKDEVYIRQDNAEEYVTDEKFQCVNFNIMDYAVSNSDILIKHKYDLQKLDKYSPENVLDMYVPCLLISIGARDDQHTTINLRKLESGLDEVLPTILPTLEYDEVIFDMTRGDRRYDDDTDISDYKVKILLKF